MTENIYHEFFPEFVCCFCANVELKFVLYEVVYDLSLSIKNMSFHINDL